MEQDLNDIREQLRQLIMELTDEECEALLGEWEKKNV